MRSFSSNMPLFEAHNYTAITVKINQLSEANRNDEIDDLIELYMSGLIDLIKLQGNAGAAEAARAIRKNIKYGKDQDTQLRSLYILELLVLNSGHKIGAVIARDDKLLDVLKGILNHLGTTGSGSHYSKDVTDKVTALALGWRTEVAELDGYKYMASLYKFIPKYLKLRSHRAHRRTGSSNVFESAEDNAVLSPRSLGRQRSASPPSRPSTPPPRFKSPPPPRPKTASPYTEVEGSSRKKKKEKKKRAKRSRNGVRYADAEYQIPQINYKAEAPKIRQVIADCHTHTTALGNILLTLTVPPPEDERATSEFDKCRKIRRKVLRYLQYVGAGSEDTKTKEVRAMDEEFLGSLIMANEQLVDVFKKYDTACGYTEENPAPQVEDDDTDSLESYYTESSEEEEDDLGEATSSQFAQLNLSLEPASATSPQQKTPKAPPPRPAKPSKLKSLDRVSTNDTVATTSSDPFGDKHGM